MPEHKETGDVSRLDTGKCRFDLIPQEALEELAMLYTFGATKYSPNGWIKNPMAWSRMIASARRHESKFINGHRYDWKTGENPGGSDIHHAIAAAWNWIGLYIYDIHNLGEDDRQYKLFEDE